MGNCVWQPDKHESTLRGRMFKPDKHAIKLTNSQGKALDQLYAGNLSRRLDGITNLTMTALRRRGLATIKTTRGQYGFEFRWIITAHGSEAAKLRSDKARALKRRIADLVDRAKNRDRK